MIRLGNKFVSDRKSYPEKAYILQEKYEHIDELYPAAITVDENTANAWSRSKNHRSYFVVPVISAQISSIKFSAREGKEYVWENLDEGLEV